MSNETIPFLDLPGQYRDLAHEIDPAVKRVMERCDFILGEAVSEFERTFAAYIGVPRCLGVGSGTDALQLALRALEIGPGDEVITVANTFIATVEAISYVGAQPVLVDCRAENCLIDDGAVAAAITGRTRAIIPVHLYGQPAPRERLQALAARRGLAIIEDAAQAHGATWSDGARCGTWGRLSAFSFYPGKNLGAFGDGGVVGTADPVLAERIELMRNWGAKIKYHHEIKGFNSRLDTVQAAVLNVKLQYLERWNERRRELAAHYRRLLAGYDEIILPEESPWTGKHAYHLFVIRLPGGDRGAFMEFLGRRGIQTGIHYPVPVHRQKAYLDLGYEEGRFPQAERVSAEVVSLPIFPEMREDQVERVSATIGDYLARRAD